MFSRYLVRHASDISANIEVVTKCQYVSLATQKYVTYFEGMGLNHTNILCM